MLDMENLIIAGIAGLVGYFIRGFIDSFYRRRHDKYLSKIEADQKVFKLLKDVLRWDESIGFMREQDFYAGFQGSSLKPFFKFKEYCECNPSFIFIDKKLEKLRKKLYKEIFSFLNITGKHVFSDGHWSKVYPEFERDDPKVKSVSNELNDIANKICKTYDDLLKNKN